MKPCILLPVQGGVFARYVSAVEACGGSVLRDPRQAERCHALLLPGGGDLAPILYGQTDRGSLPPEPERDDLELRILRAFLSAEKPVLGICRGMQVLNVALGGNLLQDIPGHRQIRERDSFHAVQALPNSFLIPLYGEHFFVNSAHHQAVNVLGKGLQAAAVSSDSRIEAIAHERFPWFAVQWHPERMWTPCIPAARPASGEALFRFFLSLCHG